MVEPTEIRLTQPNIFLNIVWLETPVNKDKLIPDHQFGFRNIYSTIDQVDRVYNAISNSIEIKKYCLAAFLDIQQAINKFC